MIISLISTGKHVALYDEARYFFSRKGISYIHNGPHTCDSVKDFSIPLNNTDKGFIPHCSIHFTYKSDLSDWLNDLNSNNSYAYPKCGLLILLGDEGTKVKKFIDGSVFDSYSTINGRTFVITSDENFSEQLQDIYDKCMLVWAKHDNNTSL